MYEIIEKYQMLEEKEIFGIKERRLMNWKNLHKGLEIK